MPILPSTTTINYRNGIFQGFFDFTNTCRQGAGILYYTSSHEFIVSHWNQNKPHGHTFMFTNHREYMYGNWCDGFPDGISVSRLNDIIVLCQYQGGRIVGRMLVIFQQYNIGTIVQVGQLLENSQIIEKSELYRQQQFDYLINQCFWDTYDSSYQTAVKYISENVIGKGIRIKLVENSYYRYGFDHGLAVSFNDQYDRLSIGVHDKNQISELGIKFKQNNLTEQGNWAKTNQVFAYYPKYKPTYQLQKLYYQSLLKGINYVNEYLTNPGEVYKEILIDFIKGQFGKMLISGLITSRKIDYSLQQTERVRQKIKQDEQKQLQQKIRLEIIKEELYGSIRRKQLEKSIDDSLKKQLKRQDKQTLISKSPVGKLYTRNSPIKPRQYLQQVYEYPVIRRDRRNTIFGISKSKSRSRSISPSFSHSPSATTKKKIFAQDRKSVSSYYKQQREPDSFTKNRAIQFQKPFDKKIQQQSPNQSQFSSKQRKSNLKKKYESPYQNLVISAAKNATDGSIDHQIRPIPITMTPKKNRNSSQQQRSVSRSRQRSSIFRRENKMKEDSKLNEDIKIKIHEPNDEERKKIRSPSISASKNHFNKSQKTSHPPNNSVYLKNSRNNTVYMEQNKNKQSKSNQVQQIRRQMSPIKYGNKNGKTYVDMYRAQKQLNKELQRSNSRIKKTYDTKQRFQLNSKIEDFHEAKKRRQLDLVRQSIEHQIERLELQNKIEREQKLQKYRHQMQEMNYSSPLKRQSLKHENRLVKPRYSYFFQN